jgi:uncharacterized membrane protein (DUF106 family)
MMFEFLFNPLLAVEPMIVVIIFASVILFVINLFQKFLVNQEEAKQVKDSIKEISNRMKEEQKQGNTEKANELMKEMMSKNSRMMSMSMKPMLISFIIVILLFPWLANTYGDKTVLLNDNKGELIMNNVNYTIQKNVNAIIINTETCNYPCVRDFNNQKWLVSYKESGCFLFSCSPERVEFARIIVFLPVTLPFLGNYMGWLVWYLTISVPTAIIIRKILKISV